MSGHFKPLRRKFGVGTLVMACVLMVGWVRSFVNADKVDLKNSPTFHAGVTSHQGWLEFAVVKTPKDHPSGLKKLPRVCVALVRDVIEEKGMQRPFGRTDYAGRKFDELFHESPMYGSPMIIELFDGATMTRASGH